MVNRRGFLRALAGGAAASAAPGLAASAAGRRTGRPNVVLVFCDDLGYGDLGCYGNPITKTPNLDRFASGGVKFTHCYAAAPNCSPSRVGLLTGRTPFRVGMYDIMTGATAKRTLPESEITVAELLKGVGYDTFHAAKWHLSRKDEAPEAAKTHGFDVTEPRSGSATETVAAFARWLDGRGDASHPFFAYLAVHETHEPVQKWSPERYRAMYGQAEARRAAAGMPYGWVPKYGKRSRSGDPRVYYGAVSQLDAAFGRLLEVLEERGLRDDTFLFFTSDNGPEHRAGFSFGSPGPLRGAKGHLHEGGIRVPGLLQWPGRTKPGAVCDQPINGTDVLPTLCALAGAAVPTDRVIDGTNLLPALEGNPLTRPRPLYWSMWAGRGGFQYAMREGDWKILAGTPPLPDGRTVLEHIKSGDMARWQLVNLRADPTESKDLSGAEPDRFEAMKRAFLALHREVLAEGPDWDLEEMRKKARYLWPVEGEPDHPYTDGVVSG